MVHAVSGGKSGGGTQLTGLGHALIVYYDALAERVDNCAATELRALGQ